MQSYNVRKNITYPGHYVSLQKYTNDNTIIDTTVVQGLSGVLYMNVMYDSYDIIELNNTQLNSINPYTSDKNYSTIIEFDSIISSKVSQYVSPSVLADYEVILYKNTREVPNIFKKVTSIITDHNIGSNTLDNTISNLLPLYPNTILNVPLLCGEKLVVVYKLIYNIDENIVVKDVIVGSNIIISI